MAYITKRAPRVEDEEIPTGGPIAALVVAIPISLLLWGVVMYVLFNLIR